jgi:uncharacterized membrane protein YdjX (TVP38/TMEM64 family)
VRENLFDVDALRARLQAEETAHGNIASLAAFFGVSALLIGVGLPRLYVAAIAGAIYGAFEGAALAYASALAGSAITFTLGRSLLASMARRRLGGKLATWRDRFRAQPFWWVLHARLLPFTNATLTTLACGACRVPFRKFMLASAIGFVPLTVVFVFFGSGGAKGSHLQMAAGAACLIASIVLQRVFKRMHPEGENDGNG